MFRCLSRDQNGERFASLDATFARAKSSPRDPRLFVEDPKAPRWHRRPHPVAQGADDGQFRGQWRNPGRCSCEWSVGPRSLCLVSAECVENCGVGWRRTCTRGTRAWRGACGSSATGNGCSFGGPRKERVRGSRDAGWLAQGSGAARVRHEAIGGSRTSWENITVSDCGNVVWIQPPTRDSR